MTATPRTWHFLATAAAVSAVFVLAYLFFVQGYVGQLIDEQARQGVQFGSVTASAVLDDVPMVSGGVVLVAVAIGLLRRRFAATVVALSVVVAANLMTQLLKHELLIRPDNGATDTVHNSFPSGHTTVIASAMVALFLVSAPRVRPWIAGLGAMVVGSVGAMLVASGWHRPSDVIGAILVVAIFVFLGGAVLAHTQPRPLAARGGTARTVALLVVAATVAVAAFGLAYLTADASAATTKAAAIAGLVGIAAAAGGSAVLTAGLFRRVA